MKMKQGSLKVKGGRKAGHQDTASFKKEGDILVGLSLRKDDCH